MKRTDDDSLLESTSDGSLAGMSRAEELTCDELLFGLGASERAELARLPETRIREELELTVASLLLSRMSASSERMEAMPAKLRGKVQINAFAHFPESELRSLPVATTTGANAVDIDASALPAKGARGAYRMWMAAAAAVVLLVGAVALRERLSGESVNARPSNPSRDLEEASALLAIEKGDAKIVLTAIDDKAWALTLRNLPNDESLRTSSLWVRVQSGQNDLAWRRLSIPPMVNGIATISLPRDPGARPVALGLAPANSEDPSTPDLSRAWVFTADED